MKQPLFLPPTQASSGHATVLATPPPSLPCITLPCIRVSAWGVLSPLPGYPPRCTANVPSSVKLFKLCFLAGRTHVLSSLVSIAFHNIFSVRLRTMHFNHLLVSGFRDCLGGSKGSLFSSVSSVPCEPWLHLMNVSGLNDSEAKGQRGSPVAVPSFFLLKGK